ncbi:MAG: TIGR00725 family protein [Candidatus Heimdallarchaeota archaeon]|nr:TIGR00725 family protein [Candidatus Heimdallarchaeota archaeon]
MSGKLLIGVIGGSHNTAKDKDLELAFNTGKLLIDNGYRLISGGLTGVMEAASKGARTSEKYKGGEIVCILPMLNKQEANPYCDIIITTGMGYARNQIIVASADALVAIGGGTGTLSEIAFAWQMGKPIFAYNIPGWSGELAGKTLDNKRTDKVITIKTPKQLLKLLTKLL